MPQINREFQLHVYVTVDINRAPNFEPEQFQEAINQTNEFFSPIGISFKQCAFELVPDYNFDVLDNGSEFQELRTLYFDNHRINVYILDRISESNVCGFAELSGIAESAGTFVALEKKCPNVLTHELGHMFGLEHTFAGNRNELVDGSNCATTGDRICDTPADPYIIGAPIQWQSGCEFIYEGLDPNGQFYQPDVGNIMSYYDCQCGFTFEQYLKMANTYLEGAKKIW